MALIISIWVGVVYDCWIRFHVRHIDGKKHALVQERNSNQINVAIHVNSYNTNEVV